MLSFNNNNKISSTFNTNCLVVSGYLLEREI